MARHRTRGTQAKTRAGALLFAPGAGAPCSSAWMTAWRERLHARVLPVETFDYSYMQRGKRRPDPHSQLLLTHRQALERARGTYGPAVVLIGKSMGGRIGCHVALVESVPALVCLGYPLRSASSGALRDQVLLELATPILFVQGTRDPLCPLDQLEAVRRHMKAPSELYVIEAGDHSLQVTQRQLRQSGLTQADVDEGIAGVIARFVSAHLSSSPNARVSR